MIVENKTHGLGKETVYDFKYVPQYSTPAELGDYHPSAVVTETGVERRNLRALVLASTVFALVLYVGMRITWGLVGGLRAWWGA